MWYVGIYSFFAIGYGAFSGIRAFTLVRSNLKAVKKLHKNMIKGLLKAPINNFYDRIPIGRILNRFSDDLNVCDL